MKSLQNNKTTTEPHCSDKVMLLLKSLALPESEGAKLLEQINKAIDCSLPKVVLDCSKEDNKYILPFCQYLKGIDELSELSATELKPILKSWCEKSKPFIGSKPFGKIRADFAYFWKRVKYSKGNDKLKKAVAKALEATYIPPIAIEYNSLGMALLVKVCIELQLIQGQEPFWLSCRSAAGIVGVSPMTICRWMELFIDDKLLEIAEPHTTKKATRYRFIAEMRG